MAMLTCFLFFSVLIITVNKVEADHLVPKNDPTVTEAVEGNENVGKVILLHHPINTRSHRIQQDALLEGLLARGHRVVGVFPQEGGRHLLRHPLYTEILVEDRLAALYVFMTKTMMEEDYSNPLVFLSLIPNFMEKWVKMISDTMIDSQIVVERLREMNVTPSAMTSTVQFHFTVVQVWEAFGRPPLIGFSPPGVAMHISKFLGNIENPAYMPELQASFVEPMTFSQRLANTIMYSIQDYDLLGQFWIPRFMDFASFDLPQYIESLHSIDLLLLASHHVTHSPQVTPPNIVEVGGLHCRPGLPLPHNLQQVLDGSPQGVILVSFGSAVKPSQMTEERRAVFLEVFQLLEGYTVIWKWDEESVEGLPANVVLSKWLPQQDLLAHPNLRVFVTHGGLLSLQEALYHKVPLVGIPLGNDQKPNLLRAEARGYAVLLDWRTLSTDMLYRGILRALGDASMQSSVEDQHRLFLDRPMSAVDTAVWWVEYTMRHNGASHLRPASLTLSWWQYYLLDVIAFLIITLIIFIFVSIKLFCFIVRCCCSRKVKTE